MRWKNEFFAGRVAVTREETLISALLEQGVSEEVIVNAYRAPKITEQGSVLAQKLGITQDSFRNSDRTLAVLQAAGVLMIGFLIGGTCFFLVKRERFYSEASKSVESFAEGNFIMRLPENQEGAVYGLFSSINELAMSFKSKLEVEEQTRKFLKSTISDISHQLKTPLAALHMYQEIIEEEPENQETVKQFAQKSTSALNRMDRLIQLLLKVTRLDAGSITFTKQSCDVGEMIREAIAELRVRAESEQKQMILQGDDGIQIQCDLLWTEEAVMNLVKNALDHTRENDKVYITWKRTPTMVKISVADNGEGIPQEDIHHIFKRFYRGSKANDTPGIGLGLSLAKSIVEGQDGTLTVESAVGEGSAFTICL